MEIERPLIHKMNRLKLLSPEGQRAIAALKKATTEPKTTDLQQEKTGLQGAQGSTWNHRGNNNTKKGKKQERRTPELH